jgi:diguanylate cyclase (GGDEF)-like protein/PAS domain S-box-containing protein
VAGIINLAKPNFLDRLTENRYGRTGETFIVTPQNRMIVSSSDKKRVMEVLPAPGINPWIDRFMQGYEGSAVVANPHGLEVLVTVKQVPIAGWYTSVILSTEEAFAPINAARYRFLAYLGPLALVVMVGLIWWALRRQLTPLMDATHTLTQLALSVQPPQPLPITRNDEVGALIGGFNHLLQTLTQRQGALQESEARFKVLADNAPALIWMIGLDGQASYFNQVWLDFTGRSQDQEVGSGWMQGVHPDDLQRASLAFKSTFQARQPFRIDYRLRRFDGEFRWLTFHGVPRYDAKGQFAGFIGSGIDITERKQSEERLQLLASVFTHADEGILISRADGTILDINEGFSRITGYSLAEVLGKTPRILASDQQDKAFYESMWQTLLSSGQWRGEVWNRRKNGELYPALLTISAVRDAQGQVSHYVSLSSDISALKAHESQLEKMAHFDNLTGLPNRLMLMDRLQQAMPQTQRRAQRLALVFIDLDGFKAVNDQYGHEAGDVVLQTVASRMKHALREGDTLARLGGDEFVAVLLDVGDLHLFEALLQRQLAAAAQPVAVGELTLQVSASLGVTFYPQADDLGADQLLRQADLAMYRAKLDGKNRFAVYSALAR